MNTNFMIDTCDSVVSSRQPEALTQVVNITHKSSKRLFTSRFNIRETIKAGKAASKEVHYLFYMQLSSMAC